MWEIIISLVGTGGIGVVIRQWGIPACKHIMIIGRAVYREYAPSDPKNGNGSVRDQIYEQTRQLNRVLTKLDEHGDELQRQGDVQKDQGAAQVAMHERLDLTAKKLESHIKEQAPVTRAFTRLMHERAVDGAADLLAEEAATLDADTVINAMVERGLGRDAPRGPVDGVVLKNPD